MIIEMYFSWNFCWNLASLADDMIMNMHENVDLKIAKQAVIPVLGF